MENTGNIGKPAEEIYGDEINLLDLLLVLAKHRNLIIGMSFGAALLAAAAILGQLNLGGIAGAAGGNSSALFVRILESRRVAEQVVKKFDLDDLSETSIRGEPLGAVGECCG